ncbi:hypothetical protein EC991_005597 [Linnemannia zychae]|nr:hypothetical protein EC991_005597 [Linnemannia zychae]
MMTTNTVPVPSCRKPGPNVFNVLLLGETQAGKSTFVQAIKRYANPNHSIEKDTIGSGNTSKTKTVRRHCIDTKYPVHKVHQETQFSDGSPITTTVKIDAILDENRDDWEDYQDALNSRKKKKTLYRCEDPKDQEMHHIHIFDTPGLNDTNGQDEIHIASIIKSLKTAGSIHLVLVIVGNSPFTPGFTSALKCYMEVFPEFQGVIAFVHTKFDYVNLHPLRKDKIAGMVERKKNLHDIMGRQSCKHYVIDCDLEMTKPIRICITQNTIRQILMEAKTNLPVSIGTDTVRKTPKMKVVDKAVINKYNAILTATNETLKSKNSEQSAATSRIAELDTRVNDALATEKEMTNYVRTYDTSDYIFIDERSFDQPWSLLFSERRHVMSLPTQEHTIRQVIVHQEHIDIKEMSGGDGHKYWEIDFKRRAFKHGVLGAKFYTTSAEKFRLEIADAWKTLTIAQRDLPDAIKELTLFTADKERLLQEIGVLLKRNKLATDMIAMAKEPSLKLAQFEESVAKGTYSGDDADAAETVESRYMKMVSKEE